MTLKTLTGVEVWAIQFGACVRSYSKYELFIMMRMVSKKFVQKKNFNRQGFTLVELLMVIAIVAILAAVAVPNFVNFGNDARSAITQQRMSELKAAIIGDGRMVGGGKYTKPGFITHCLGPPSVLSDLVLMPKSGTCSVAYDPFLQQGWRGPYISATDPNYNMDAWGNPFIYDSVAQTITSWGPNGKDDGGLGDDIVVSF